MGNDKRSDFMADHLCCKWFRANSELDRLGSNWMSWCPPMAAPFVGRMGEHKHLTKYFRWNYCPEQWQICQVLYFSVSGKNSSQGIDLGCVQGHGYLKSAQLLVTESAMLAHSGCSVHGICWTLILHRDSIWYLEGFPFPRDL